MEHLKKAIDWLKKQGEQKPADKIEPKFKDGDYIVYRDYVWKVFNISLEKYYELLKINNEVSTRSIEDVDNNAHLWTIQDAKDGDVLTCYSDIKGQPIEQTGIIKQYVGRHGGCSNSFKAHFGVDWDNNVVIEGYMGSSNIYPSTKEQRDTLMKAMTDAGYTFDFEKKELKKIEQKPAWSEEDEKMIDLLIAIFRVAYPDEVYKANPIDTIDMKSVSSSEIIDWLKSLKERVQPQPKQEWSEEEKVRIDRIIDVLDWAEDKGRISYSDWEDYVTYVRCLRPQPNTKWYKLDDITRTDAFIKKACEWLENNLQGIVGGSIYIEDFRKYMKGE